MFDALVAPMIKTLREEYAQMSRAGVSVTLLMETEVTRVHTLDGPNSVLLPWFNGPHDDRIERLLGGGRPHPRGAR